MKSKLLKNVYATIVVLFIVMFALPTEMQAQTEYDLWIAGVQVTSENCHDLSKIEGVSGTVQYYPENKLLMLYHAKISAKEEDCAIESKIDGLQIVLLSANEVTAETAAIVFKKPMTITGGGMLNARSLENCAIYMNGTDLTIKHCTVNAIGKEYGIAGGDAKQELLSIERSRVTAEGTGKGSIMDIAGLSLKECTIVEPAGAKYDETKRGVVLNGELVKSKVIIEPTITSYFRIAGVQVTSANCDDLSVIPGVSGTVVYDPAANVLILEDAKINAEGDDFAIDSQTDDLRIYVIGTNELNAKIPAIWTGGSLRIAGSGTLNVKSLENSAILVHGTTLEIMDCKLNAIGKLYGIVGEDDTDARLSIIRATVTAEGSKGTIYDFTDFKLYESFIIQPKGAMFDASLGGGGTERKVGNGQGSNRTFIRLFPYNSRCVYKPCQL